MMDPNQVIINRYVIELNKRNFSILDEFLALEVIVGTDKITKDQYRQQIEVRIEEILDYFVEINKMETKGDTVILHWHRTGTNKKTGERLDEELTSEYKISDGKIVEVN